MRATKKEDYIFRILDDKVKEQLDAFGAVLIRGPKWCGKTTTGEFFTKSAIYLDDIEHHEEYESISKNNPSLFLEGEKPRLLDEWQTFPIVWDGVRRYIDKNPFDPSLFILTGSYSPKIGKTIHTGSMRISIIDMETMSLYETKESTGEVSLIDLFDKNKEFNGESKLSKEDLNRIMVRGGWPIAVIRNPQNSSIYGRQAFQSLISTELTEALGYQANTNIARTLVKSLARNISTPVKNKTILEDMIESGNPLAESTFYEYLDALRRLFVIREVPAWNPNIRSATSIRSLPKKCFYETALACAALSVNEQALSTDFKTRGLLFETLCARDLSVYASKYDGTLNYYRDRLGLECDYVIHLEDGRYGLFECKCGDGYIEEGAKNLNKLEKIILEHIKENPTTIMKPPSCKVILTDTQYVIKRKDGVIIVPLACLKY